MIHILTLSWNGKDKLNTLYPTLINNLKNIDYKWLIKDNNSSDDSLELIKSWDNSNVISFAYKHNNDSFSQGCNFLFNEAKPKDDDLILLLNNDIIFNDSKSLQNMISIIKNDDNVGVVGAKLNYTNTRKLQHAGVIFDTKYNSLPFHYRPNQMEDRDAKKNREFQAITGAVMLTKAKYYDNICQDNKSKLKGLEDYFWSFEDISACLSIKYNMNKKIVYCGQTNIFHEESASLKKNPVNKLFMSSNISTFFNKWKGKYLIDHDSYLKDKNYNLYIK